MYCDCTFNNVCNKAQVIYIIISPLQLGLSVFLHGKFESKNIINILSSLGFCSTYYEALLFEASSISHPQPDILPDSFTQFVFDNADFNVNTLDGLHTFHSMDGIQCQVCYT